MSKTEELDKLDKAIKDADIRLKSIQNNIEQLDKEISVLTPCLTELEKNITFLKKSSTIPLAHEFRKNKTELSKVKARLILICADRKRADEAVKQVMEIIDKFKRDYYNLIKTSENNVLAVEFGGRRGKK